MTKQTNPNQGALFKNDRKTKDTHPHATGSATIICPHCNWGTDYFMDAWTNTPKGGGDKFQSVKFKAKDKQSGATTPAAQAARPVGARDDDSEIPF